MRREQQQRGQQKHGQQSALDRRATASETYRSTAFELPPGTDLFRIKDDTTIRGDILKYKAGKNNRFADPGFYWHERTYWVHNNIGPDNNKYTCPAMEAGSENMWPGYATNNKGVCPVCEEIERLHLEGGKQNEAIIKRIRLQERQLFNWVDATDPDRVVQIFDSSYYAFGKKLYAYTTADKDDECRFQKFFNWGKGGATIRIAVEAKQFEKGGKPVYLPETITMKRRAKPYPPTIAKEVHCLDDLIKVLPYGKLKQLLLHTGEAEESEQQQGLRRSDVKRVRSMTERELQAFIIVNDLAVDPDDCETLDDLREAVTAEVKDALQAPSKTKRKKASKKAKPVAEDEYEDEEYEDEESEEGEDEEYEDEESEDDGDPGEDEFEDEEFEDPESEEYEDEDEGEEEDYEEFEEPEPEPEPQPRHKHKKAAKKAPAKKETKKAPAKKKVAKKKRRRTA